jgi:ribonuclease-3
MEKLLELQEKLGYYFLDKNLLARAITHPSLSKKTPNLEHYERLEFLGNSILGAALAHLIYQAFPEAKEGKLSIIQAKLASTDGINKAIEGLNLGLYLQMDLGEEKNGGRTNPRNLEDSLEAIVGALYLDGGYEAALKFIKNFWNKFIKRSKNLQRDPKSRLQEFCQKKALPLPAYQIISQEGPVHNPTFCIKVSIFLKGEEFFAQGKGSNKKVAELEAAQKLFRKVNQVCNPSPS